MQVLCKARGLTVPVALTLTRRPCGAREDGHPSRWMRSDPNRKRCASAQPVFASIWSALDSNYGAATTAVNATSAAESVLACFLNRRTQCCPR